MITHSQAESGDGKEGPKGFATGAARLSRLDP